MDDRTTGGEDAREGDDPQSRCLQETLAEAQLVFTELSRLFEQVTGAKRSAALRALDDEQDAVLLGASNRLPCIDYVERCAQRCA